MPSEKTLPARLNMDIISRLQQVTAPEIFSSRAVYDGRKNLFAGRELPFGGASSREVGTFYMVLCNLVTYLSTV
jgi:eukaryotic translation initiation factor 2C